MANLPIYQICVSDTDPAPIKGFYNSPIGIKLLKDMLKGIITDQNCRLEKVTSTGMYRISLFLICTYVDEALRLGAKLEETYQQFKELLNHLQDLQQNEEEP